MHKNNTLEHYVSRHQPCYFITNFDGSTIEVYSPETLAEADIDIAFLNHYQAQNLTHHLTLSFERPVFQHYEKKIDAIQEHIKCGNTYVLNLTQPTPLLGKWDFKTIFNQANAPFKIRYKDDFVCFSPEPFIHIEGNQISTFPMKGTIDASLPDAKNRLLKSEKEHAEHVMIVDLLRNDLSQIATNVTVKRFRYMQKIAAGEKELWQSSSHIIGTLPSNWQHHFSDMLQKLLPAGSISGTPKKRTVEIIKETEGYERGFYTGVCGYFDGNVLNSFVMIRFIERSENGFVYKSGGGITLESSANEEFDEMLQKIYIP